MGGYLPLEMPSLRSISLFCLALSLWADQPVSKPPGAKAAGKAYPQECRLSQAQVERWTKAWQKRLGLEDWDVTIQIVRASELRPETLGNLRWNSATHSAVIRVLSATDYDLPAPEIPLDVEYTVVHELVHLHLAVLPRDAANKAIEERVVSRIAEALLALQIGPGYRPRRDVVHLNDKDKYTEASRFAKFPK